MDILLYFHLSNIPPCTICLLAWMELSLFNEFILALNPFSWHGCLFWSQLICSSYTLLNKLVAFFLWLKPSRLINYRTKLYVLTDPRLIKDWRLIWWLSAVIISKFWGNVFVALSINELSESWIIRCCIFYN